LENAAVACETVSMHHHQEKQLISVKEENQSCYWIWDSTKALVLIQFY